MKFSPEETKSRFLIKNTLYGLLGLVGVTVVFTLISHHIRNHFTSYLGSVPDHGFLFYGIFTISEVVLSLIPPEFFMMIYILNHISSSQFMLNVFILSLISYGAGVLNYVVARKFAYTGFMEKINTRFLKRYHGQLEKYGKYLLLAGAVTPIPFAVTCMLTGLVRLPAGSFLVVSTARILRFAVYGWIMWNIPALFNFG